MIVRCIQYIATRGTQQARALQASAAVLATASRIQQGSHAGPCAYGFCDPFSAQLLNSSRSYASEANTQLPDFQARLQAAVNPAVCAHLQQHGYVIVDGVLGGAACDLLRQELRKLYNQGRMTLNHTHLVRNNTTQLLRKPAIHEAELTLDPQVCAAAPTFAALDADRSLQILLSLFLPQLNLDSQAIKLQLNSGGGGCFPMHFDSDEELDGRRITAIFYLIPRVAAGSGRELRLYPFPDPPLDVAPLDDRLVLFSSTRMLHRVLPSSVERCCFTIWLSQRRGRSGVRQRAQQVAPQPLEQQQDLLQGGGSQQQLQQVEELVRFLMQPAVRQHVCKLLYADEWQRSIVESHAASPQLEAALATHQQEVHTISKALSKYANVIKALGQHRASSDRTPAPQQAVQQLQEAASNTVSSSSSSADQEQLQQLVGQVLQMQPPVMKWL